MAGCIVTDREQSTNVTAAFEMLVEEAEKLDC